MNREVAIILGKTGYGKSTWLSQYAQKFARIFIFDPFAKFPAEYITAEELIARYDDKRLEQTQYKIGTMKLADFDLFGSMSFVVGNCVFIIEECGYAFYKGERIPDWLGEIVFLGRHSNTSLVMTAQRAISIPVELRSQAQRFISFRQTERKDVDWTRDYIGERVLELPNLPHYECLDSDGDFVTRYKVNPSGANSPALTEKSAPVG